MNRYLLAGNKDDIEPNEGTAGTTTATRKVGRKYEIIHEINNG